MKNILTTLKNLLPYLILVVIYFIFVNIEAQNNQKANRNLLIESRNKSTKEKKPEIDKFRIKIPVIPYKD
tara:strand:- start:267 stop:476 length:210 start_codon:yes stop_codon:yes gene_type:complete